MDQCQKCNRIAEAIGSYDPGNSRVTVKVIGNTVHSHMTGSQSVKSEYDTESRQQAVELAQKGLSMAQIAARMGLSRQRVWQLLNTAGYVYVSAWLPKDQVGGN